jgi:hypothetical protein
MKRGLVIAAAILGMVSCWLFLAGCGESRQPYAGNYRSVEPFAGKGHVELELKENGEATWKLAQEGTAAKFKWKVEGDRIWLYTKEGGVIIAIPSEGGQKLTVDMTGQWNPSCPMEHCILFERVKGGGS